MRIKLGKEYTTIKMTNRQAQTLQEMLKQVINNKPVPTNQAADFYVDLEIAYRNPVEALSRRGKKK